MTTARVFVDGTLTDPRLDHPECVAVHPDGSVWCGGELGQIYRIEPDGSAFEEVARTGGFSLGIAFDRSAEGLYVCDNKSASVVHVELSSGGVRTFAEGAGGHRLKVPNYPAVDERGRVYVSDSHGFHDPGPGVFRFEQDGSGELWYGEPVDFAHGLALAPDGASLYVVETFGRNVFRVPIEEDGSAGAREHVVHLPGVLPDGIAFDAEGTLHIGCYEPSQVMRVDPDGVARVLVADPDAHLLCHPTNLAFRGSTLFAANLGRWHITAIDL
jgi:sugar lactone lactonase YvrE